MEINEPADVEQLEATSFKVTDAGSANWALGKHRYYSQRLKEVAELYDEEQRRLDDWRDEQVKELSSSIDWFENHLVQYHAELYAEDEKRKTVKFPNGNLVSRSVGGGIVIDDEETFLAEAPEVLLNIKKTANKTALKELLKETGELPKGVSVEPKTRKFSVEVSM